MSADTSAVGQASSTVEDETKVVDSGVLSVTYAPDRHHSGSQYACVLAKVESGKVGAPTMTINLHEVGSREQWEAHKAQGDRAWAEWDKALAAREARR